MFARRSYALALLVVATGTVPIIACGDDDTDITPAPVPTTPTTPAPIPTTPPVDSGPVGTAPKITTAAALPAIDVGAPIEIKIEATGTAPVTFTITGGLAPGGMTLSAAGLLAGTPTAVGTFNFTVQVVNGVSSDSVAFTLEVKAPPTDAYALLSGNRLVAFSTAFPAASSAAIVLTSDDAVTLMAIDRRPQTGHIYAVGTVAGEPALYRVNIAGSSVHRVGALATFVPAITGATFGMDFNPAADRVRVVTATGFNLRFNPNTGDPVDTIPATVPIEVDAKLAGAGTTGEETAYTNNSPNNGIITTQYTITGTKLCIQNPPNAGTLTLPIDITGGIESVVGFDIPSGVNTATTNTAVASGAGFIVSKLTGQNGLQLASLDLVSGKATPIGALPAATRGFTLARPTPRMIFALSSDGASLLSFAENAAATVKTSAITGVAAGESLVGIDFRPATGQLYGFAVKVGDTTGTLYIIDAASGAATRVGATPGLVTFVSKTGNPISFPNPTAVQYGVDFNSAVDRMRVVTSSGLNFRINPSNGAPVDGNYGEAVAPAGINPDADITLAGGLSEVAYTNDAPKTGALGFTAEYGLDASANALHLFTNPNLGTLGPALAVTLNAAPLDFTAVAGFDIPQTVVTPSNNVAPPAGGAAYAALTVGASTGLYTINLITGVATLIGPIGAGSVSLRGLTVGP